MFAALVVAPAPALAAPPAHDIRGVWSGAALNGAASGTVTWESEDCGTGAISGRGATPTDTWTASGTIDGSTVTIAFTGFSSDATYRATGTGSFTDANHISGTFRDTDTHKDVPGTFELVRTSGPPQDGQGCGTGRTTATTVRCDYHVASGTDTCTATVADVGPPPLVAPTGAVTFTSAAGVFTAGDSCTVAPTPGSPGVVSCAVEYRPPSSAFPSVVAAYGGDPRHTASSASSEALVLGGPPEGEDAFPAEEPCSTTGSGAGAGTAPSTPQPWTSKVCAVLGVVGGIVMVAAGGGAEGTVLGIPLGLWLQGGGIVVVIGSFAVIKDPPDPHFAELARPPSAPLGRLPAVRRCGTRARTCARIRPAAVAYLAALKTAAAEGLALAISGNRLSSALAAGDAAASGLQTAAVKLYAGRYAAALAVLHGRGVRLGRALRGAGLDRRVGGADLDEAVSVVKRPPNPAVARALALVGKTPAELAQEVRRAAPKARLGARPTLSSLLARATPTSGYRRDARSMTLENVRDLVRGLTSGHLVAVAAGDTLLNDVSCGPSHPAPRPAEFLAHVRDAVREPAAGLLRSAIAPLASVRVC